MMPVQFLIAAALFGGVFADVCEQDSGLRPLLVTSAEPTPTVYVWPGEQVQLHCRPSQSGGCRWMKGSTELGRDCRLNTTERGTIKCLRGDKTCGIIRLDTPRRQYVQHNNPWTSWRYRGQTHWQYKSSTFLCESGTIIHRGYLCDGTSHCDNSEDEWNCESSCGTPFVGEHSALSSDVLEIYPDGSEVTYVCHPGFIFAETLSGLNRTCRAGRWTPSPPICRRNVALNRTVSVTGQPMTDCGTAVDGVLSTWCMLAPSGGPQALSVQLADNVTVTKVLVRAFNDRYTVSLRGDDQSLGELSCPCQRPNDADIHPAASGVRVCTCPEDQTEDRSELLVRAESGAFISLSVAEIVALETSDADVDDCALVDHPAHGRFEPAGPGMVKLSCDLDYSPSCSDAVRCFSVGNGDVWLSCLGAAECPQPPAIPDTEITHESGTGRGSVTEYRCRPGYALYPADQNTTSSCDADGLWSIGHISCLSETDIRVVAMRLGQQHALSMAALRAELLAGQQRLLTEQNRLLAEQNRLLAEQNETQQRLSKLERDVALMGLADRARLQAAKATAAEEQLELAELARHEAASQLEQQLGTDTELEELDEGAAELAQLTELEQQLSEPDTADDVEVEVIQ